MDKPELSATDVNAVLKELVPSHKGNLALLNYYARVGLVVPSGTTRLRGRRCYRFEEVVLLVWLFKMKTGGWPAHAFKPILSSLQRRLRHLVLPAKNYIAVGRGNRVKVCHLAEAGQEVEKLLKPSAEAGWFYPIGQLVDEVHAVSLQRPPKPSTAKPNPRKRPRRRKKYVTA